MSAFWIKCFQLIACFALLIILHEGGHFFFAKLFKTRVSKFYMFFNPQFVLFRCKKVDGKWRFRFLAPNVPEAVVVQTDVNGEPLKDDKGNALLRSMTDEERAALPEGDWRREPDNTEYGLGWVPLGGYCQIVGMIDETQNAKNMASESKPYEFRSKTVWQRFLVMVGGVLVNFVLALGIYAAILYTWGRDVIPMKNIEKGFSYNAMAQDLGFEDGDLPVKIDGEVIAFWDVNVYRSISTAKCVTVLRDGREVNIDMPAGGVNLLEMLEQEPRFLSANVPAVLDSVMEHTPAYEAGLRKGMRLVAIDGEEVTWWSDFDDIMGRRADILLSDCSHEDSVRLRTITLAYRTTEEATDSLTALVDTVTLTLGEDYRFGFVKKHYATYYDVEHLDYGLLESIPAGISFGWETMKDYVSDLRYLFSKKGAQSVGSFGTIGNLFPATWDWQSFWSITAFISLILAFMNIIPIPGLDGGHILFLLVEAVTRRQPSERFMEIAQYAGMILLLGLMCLALFNDFVKFVL